MNSEEFKAIESRRQALLGQLTVAETALRGNLHTRGFGSVDMAEKLVKRGVPQAEMAFIQDYDADNAKLALFRSVNAGKVRILFGSTQKMGRERTCRSA